MHGGQRCSRIVRCFDRHRQGSLKCVPHSQQLAARCIKQGRKFGVDAGPIGIACNLVSLGLPVGHINFQGIQCRLCITPRLDRQHLNTLTQQNGGFALHLGAVLQVFNGFNPLSQLDLDAGQRLFRQRRTSFGGIALPGQGISQIELANC